MIKQILARNKYSTQKKIVALFKYLFYLNISTFFFRKRYKDYKQRGVFKQKIATEQAKQYKNYWKVFGNKVELKTINACYNISGVFDKRIIPENIFFANIELTLNDSSNISFLQNKSIYNRWYRNGSFPKDYLHRMNGKFYDAKLNELNKVDVDNILNNLQYPVVVKPNIDSAGGKDVYFVDNILELRNHIDALQDLVVQEKLVQSNLLNGIYNSINTVRVCLYKSVRDNNFYVINSALRVGRDGKLDNESGGGLVCFIDETGKLRDIAVNKYGEKFREHPNTREKFGFNLPYFNELCEASKLVCKDILYARLVSLDMCLDHTNTWRAIEVNLLGHTIRFAQYAGQPFFGEFTDEVIEYCLENHWAYQDQKLFN